MLAKTARFCQWAETRAHPYKTRIPPELAFPTQHRCEIASQQLNLETVNRSV